MLNLNDFKSITLSDEETILLQGGDTIYRIGKDEVSRDTYKAHVECVTGEPSKL